jgi:hypothetical protein
MLRLVVFDGIPLLLPPLRGLLLAGTAAVSAFVSSAVKLSFADAEAVRVNNAPLMARRPGRCPAATARYVDVLAARRAGASVAFVRAQMTTSQNLIAGLVAVRDRILTRLPWFHGHRIERSLAARAVGDNVWREGAVGGRFILGVTWFLAGVVPAVECPATDIVAAE